MANRNMLHKSKLGEFEEWLISEGFAPVRNAAAHEALRWKAESGPMPIIFCGKSSEHFSCNEASVPFVNDFLRKTKGLQNKPEGIDKETVKRIALENGFELEEQADGVMDLNAQVYKFASALTEFAAGLLKRINK